jgi:uncharacterized protein YndB with AHSA1/START domain
MNFTKITITATISADRNKVWDYYTLPEHITKWNFASDEWHCPKATNDLILGGKYYARMEAKQGDMGFDFEAFYIDIIGNKKLSYRMSDGREVNILFKDLNPSTEIEITFDAESLNSLELQKNGWQAILNNFKKYVELNTQ